MYRNQPGRGQIVTAVSPAASVSGARIGMPVSEAQSLVGRSRQFAGHHVFEHHPAADLRALQQLAMDCQQFSPIVGLEEGDQPCSLLMDVSGLSHLFGGDDGLRVHIHRHFRALGYMVSTAIAATVGQAWALARFDQQSVEAQHDLDESQAFDSLPVAALRLSEATVDTLQQLGIQRIVQLRQLPRGGLKSRFGDEIIQRLDQADGVMPEVIQAIYPPADYQVEQYLDYPISDKTTIQTLVSRLADQLCKQMRAAGRGGLVWHFQLNSPPEERSTATGSVELTDQAGATGAGDRQLTVKLFQPSATLEHLMPLVNLQLDDLFRGHRRRPRPQAQHLTKCKSSTAGKHTSRATSQLAFQVQEIVVTVRNCVLLAERQRQLFDENPRLDKQALAHLINRLSSRLTPREG